LSARRNLADASRGARHWTIDRVIASMGATEIRVGDPAFDRRFVLQSRDERLIRRVFASADLRQAILTADIDEVELLGTKLFAYYARSARDPAHAELLFTAVTRLADAIDALEPDYRPETIRV
jgi:hypothetical protein